MKGLRKYLTPFAPDQSGAVSVLYELGGILVICDAGGCTGNICGFDEPRWFTHKSAVFSAGLRDMDAILGRDDRLVDKLRQAAEQLEASFAAIIGTPVPAVIATDYQALRRLAERRTGLPILTVDSNGMELYDAGAEKAWLALFRRFATEPCPVEPGRIGVLGMTPLDFGTGDPARRMTETLTAQGWRQVDCYGMGAGLEAIRRAGGAEENLVVSPSGLGAAEYLKKTFGTPYRVLDPLGASLLPAGEYTGRRALVIHQQVRANALREALLDRGCASVTAATWFRQLPGLTQPGDLRLREEDDLTALLAGGDYDLVLGDEMMREAAPGYAGEWIDLPHFAVSGRRDAP